jgi:hypothetical protein
MARTARSRLTPWVVAAVILAVFALWEWRYGEAIAATTPEGDARVVAVLSRVRRSLPKDARVTSVDMTSVLGSGVLDLRGVRLDAGASLVVDVVGVGGYLTIRVPDGWVVDTMTVPVFGTWSDVRRPSASVHQGTGGPAPRLVLRGAVVAGRLTVES